VVLYCPDCSLVQSLDEISSQAKKIAKCPGFAFAICYLLSAICYLLSAICYLLFAIP